MDFNPAISAAATPNPIKARPMMKPARALRRAEQGRADCGNEQQHALHAPRPIAVERYAERQLHRCEGEEVDRGKQAEVGGAQLHCRGKLGRDDSVDGAIEVREEVTGGEREQHQKDRSAISHGLLRNFNNPS